MFHIVIGLQARKLFILPTLALLVAVAAGAAALSMAQAQSGNGVYDTDGDKLIEISYLEQLFAIRYDLDGDGAVDKASDAGLYSQAFPVSAGKSVCDSDCEGYELAKSLNFRQTSSYQYGAINPTWTDTATGEGWLPIFHYGDARSIKGFDAVLDGNGNIIANLYSKYTHLDIDTGLFAVLESGATVRFLGLTGVNVIGDYSNTGALVGNNKGTVTGVYSTGGVTGDGNVGGLVGNNGGTVTQSYSTATVSSDEDYVGGLVGDNIGTISVSYATGSVSGKKKYVGGLTGYNLGTVRNSYASGNVSGVSSVGGLVGKNTSKIEYSYAASASVTGSSSIGGLVGSSVDIGSEVTDGYWDTTVGPSSSSGGIGKTTSELVSPTDYTGIYADWDDGDEGEVWDFGTSSQYPALKADLNGDGTSTVAEFGSQQVTVSLPTPTPTPIPDPTATPTPQPLGSLTGVGGGGASISGVGGNVSGGSISGGATGQSQGLPAIVLSTTTITVVEGSTASYTAKLNHEPYADVTVALSFPTLGIATANKYSLTFTSNNWNSAQTITLTGTTDDDPYGESVQVKHAASGGGYGDGTNVTARLAVSVDDDDDTGTLVASDPTATTALLALSGYGDWNWWHQRAGWNECIGPVKASSYRVRGILPNVSTSHINIYSSSSCGPTDKIAESNKFGTASPTLAVSEIKNTSAKITISEEWDLDKDGPWHYGTTGAWKWCSDPITARSQIDSPLVKGNSYTYAGHVDSNCSIGSTPPVTFVARAPTTLTASAVSARSAHLTMAGDHTGDWWYQRAGWNECHGPMTSLLAWIHGLEPDSSMYITAYETSSCGANDKLAQTDRFSTKKPTLSASDVTGDSATLTLSTDWASHDGSWYYKADKAPHTSCSAAQSGNSASISGLNPTTDYTYTTYLDSGCNTWTDFATVDFTTEATFSVRNLSGAGAGDHAIGKSWNGSQSIHYTHATSFTTGSATNGYELKSILIPFGQKIGINDFSMIVSVKNDDNGVPGDTDTIASSNFSGPAQVDNANGTYTCSGSCDLAADTTYHLVLSATHGSLNSSFFRWRATSSDDQSGPSGWSIGDDASRLVGGSSSWTSSASANAGKFKMTAEAK